MRQSGAVMLATGLVLLTIVGQACFPALFVAAIVINVAYFGSIPYVCGLVLGFGIAAIWNVLSTASDSPLTGLPQTGLRIEMPPGARTPRAKRFDQRR